MLRAAVAVMVIITASFTRPVPFIIGADISWTMEYEALGRTFKDNGEEKDIITIFKEHNFNWIRLRIFHNPMNGYALWSSFARNINPHQPFCGLEYTIAMAKRVKAAGMNLLLDFHYSDTWADPENQHLPGAWEGLDRDRTADSIYNYTTYVLGEMDRAGVLPQMVQVGNEINNGMCWPVGIELENTAILVKSGLDAVHDYNPDILTMVHSASGGDNAVSSWFMNTLLNAGCSFDALGLSCYTNWHGPWQDWEHNFNRLAEQFPDHGFIIAEYSYEKRAASRIMFNLPAEKGWGTFIWEPVTWYEEIFYRNGSTYHTNEMIDIYPEIFRDYHITGMPAVYSSELPEVSGPLTVLNESGHIRIRYSPAPGYPEVYDLIGRTAEP